MEVISQANPPEVPTVTIIPSLSRLLPLALLTLGLGACGGLQLGSLSSSTSHQGMDHAHSMDLGPADATYDLRFLDAMVVHHQGAVTMAETALKHSQRAEIRQLAEAIVASQNREIDQMQAWRKAWYPDASSTPIMYHAEMAHDMPMTGEMAAAMRMDVDLGPADQDFDRRFLDAMVPHHQGALTMAADLQAKTQRPELKALAADIIAVQTQEIDQMQSWRQAWYGS